MIGREAVTIPRVLQGSARDLIDGALARARRRNSVGVRPVSALKARLNGSSDGKPESIAIVKTGAFFLKASWSAVPWRGILGFVLNGLIYVPYIAAFEACERHMRVRQ